jgi:para-nitrobenzyl esterase
MKPYSVVAMVLIIAGLGASSHAQPAPFDGPGSATRALVLLPAKAPRALKVTSPAFRDNGHIPLENTQHGENRFPGLSWTSGPRRTRTYVVVMQDADVFYQGSTLVHWTMFNIPAKVTRLPAGMSSPVAGAAFGPNVRGAAKPYAGPKTPPGQEHHYTFQVFALDVAVADPGASFAALTGMMQGHVLASGELVGLGQAPTSGAVT